MSKLPKNLPEKTVKNAEKHAEKVADIILHQKKIMCENIAVSNMINISDTI